MANTILHKRSSTPAGTPNTGDLSLGELAVNTYDGKLYMKTDDGIGGVAIVQVGGGELGDLIVTSIPVSDTILSTKDLFQISSNAQIAFDIEDVPDYGFDTASITYTQQSSFAVTGTDMASAYIRPDGLAVYIIESAVSPGSINEYLLSTPWDITSKAAGVNATYAMLSGDHANNMDGIWFNSTGTKAIVSGATQYAEYDFPVPYDIANASFVQFVPAPGETTGHGALSFSEDGTKAYGIRRAFGVNDWFIKSLSVGTPWDVTSISMISDTDEITAETGANQPYGVVVNQDGTKLFVVHDNEAETSGSSKIREYTLGTPYLASSKTLTDSIVQIQSRYLRYMFWSPDGTDLYIMDNNATIYQYSSSALTIGGLTSRLYHNSNKRLETTSLGVLVTGSIAFEGSEAQVALPNFATLDLPATPIDGGVVFDTDTSTMKFYNGAGWTDSGATELAGLTDVGSAAITTGFVMVADGVDFKSRLLLEADIDDLGTYLTAVFDDNTPKLAAKLNTDGFSLTSSLPADVNSVSGSVVVATENGGATDGNAGQILLQIGESYSATSGAINLTGGINNTLGGGNYAGEVNLTGGLAGAGNYGGYVNIKGGYSPDHYGGSVNIDGGYSPTGTGGGVTLTGGGSNAGTGGYVAIYGGLGNTGTGGYVSIVGGVGNSGTGGDISIQAGNGSAGQAGGDVTLTPGGNLGNAGTIQVHNAFFQTGEAEIQIWRDTDTGHTTGNYVSLKAGATLSSDVTLTLPEAVGGAGDVLTDVAGDGVMSWTTPSAAGLIVDAFDNMNAGAGSAASLTASNNDNILLGFNAGALLDGSSGSNILMGNGAGASMSTGTHSSNIGIGQFTLAGLSTTGRNNNIAIGASAGRYVDAVTNTFIGKDAGKGNSATAPNLGFSNTFIGTGAGSEIEDGDYNVAIGPDAGKYIKAGTRNIAIGAFTMGSYNSNVSGFHNVAVGERASSKLTTGTYNVSMGYYAGYNIDTGDGNICIGQDCGPTGNVSNQIFIGQGNHVGYGGDTPLIHGDMTSNYITINGSFKTEGVTEVHNTLGAIGEGEVRLWRDTDTGHTTGNYVSLKAGATLAANVSLTLPEADGNADEVLTTAGATGILSWADLKHIPITTDSTTARGLLLPDDNTLITCTHNAGSVAITIPDNGTTAFPIGTQILIEQAGTSQVTVSAPGSDTLNSAGGLVSTASQYSTLTLIKTAATRWLLAGDLA